MIASGAGVQRGGAGRFVPLLGACLCATAVAQEEEPAGEPGGGAPPPEGPAPAVIDLTEEVPRLGPDELVGIRRGGPDTARDLSAVAVDPDEPAVRMVLTVDGAAWRSRDRGITWELVLIGQDTLGGASAQEDVLLDLETRLSELVEDLSSGDPEEEIDATGELQAEVRAGTAWLERVQQAGGDEALVLPRVWPLGDGRWVVGRPDGLWWSDDRGDTWRRRVVQPVVALAASGGAVVAAGPEGTWRTTDDELWVEVEGLAGVYDLAATTGGFLAVTDHGTFTSAGGIDWTQISAEGGQAVAVDPAGGWYRVKDASVQTSSDGGERWRRGGDSPIVRALDLVVLPDGAVLVAGAGGVARSTDGGGRWSVLLSGGGGAARGLGWDGEVLLVATDEGLFELSDRPVEEGRVEEWVPLGVLLAAADGRAGMNPASGRLGPGGQALLWLLPEVRVGFGGVIVDQRGSALDAGLDGSDTLYLGTAVQVTWRPPRRNLQASDNLVDIEDDGTVSVYGDGADNWMALGRSGRRAAQHRLEVAEEIVALYQRHEDLRGQIADERARTLAERVQLVLRVEEVEARLDLLTDGAVRQWSR